MQLLSKHKKRTRWVDDFFHVIDMAENNKFSSSKSCNWQADVRKRRWREDDFPPISGSGKTAKRCQCPPRTERRCLPAWLTVRFQEQFSLSRKSKQYSINNWLNVKIHKSYSPACPPQIVDVWYWQWCGERSLENKFVSKIRIKRKRLLSKMIFLQLNLDLRGRSERRRQRWFWKLTKKGIAWNFLQIWTIS